MTYPTTNVLHRVFKLQLIVNDDEGEEIIISGGTMFVIDVDNRQYLITARHIAERIDSRVQVQVWRNKGWNSIPVRIVGHGGGDVDVSVLDSSVSLIPDGHRFSLPVGLDGIVLGQEMMFLGFPTGYDVLVSAYLDTGFPMPLVNTLDCPLCRDRIIPCGSTGITTKGFQVLPSALYAKARAMCVSPESYRHINRFRNPCLHNMAMKQGCSTERTWDWRWHGIFSAV